MYTFTERAGRSKLGHHVWLTANNFKITLAKRH